MTESSDRFYVVVTQPGTALRIVLEAAREASAGREPSNLIFLAHPLVSRHHAMISSAPAGSFRVQDLGSRNGTVVNGHPTREEVVVADPVTVEIGPFVLAVSRTASDETWTAAGASAGRAPRSMLNRGTRQLHVDGSIALEVLSPHEYALLDLLCSRAPAVVERSAAGDVVWGHGQWDVYMLHNLVSRIRKRIARVGSADSVIVTVPGVGYRME